MVDDRLGRLLRDAVGDEIALCVADERLEHAGRAVGPPAAAAAVGGAAVDELRPVLGREAGGRVLRHRLVGLGDDVVEVVLRRRIVLAESVQDLGVEVHRDRVQLGRGELEEGLVQLRRVDDRVVEVDRGDGRDLHAAVTELGVVLDELDGVGLVEDLGAGRLGEALEGVRDGGEGADGLADVEELVELALGVGVALECDVGVDAPALEGMGEVGPGRGDSRCLVGDAGHCGPPVVVGCWLGEDLSYKKLIYRLNSHHAFPRFCLLKFIFGVIIINNSQKLIYYTIYL